LHGTAQSGCQINGPFKMQLCICSSWPHNGRPPSTGPCSQHAWQLSASMQHACATSMLPAQHSLHPSLAHHLTQRIKGVMCCVCRMRMLRHAGEEKWRARGYAVAVLVLALVNTGLLGSWHARDEHEPACHTTLLLANQLALPGYQAARLPAAARCSTACHAASASHSVCPAWLPPM
jgi:hypothetical protein